MKRLWISLAASCARPAAVDPPPRPAVVAIDARAADASFDAQAAPDADIQCTNRCESIVRSRHDACGRYSKQRPDWCADSNRQMLLECEFGCGSHDGE